MSKSSVVSLCFLVAVLCGAGTNFLFGHRVHSGSFAPLHPFAFNLVRYWEATLILGFIALMTRTPLRIRQTNWPRIGLLSVTTLLVPHSLIATALFAGKVGEFDVAFLESAIVGVVLVYLFFDPKKRSLGFSCGVLGVGLAVAIFYGWKVYESPDDHVWSTGHTYVLLSAVVSGAGLVFAERLQQKFPSGTFRRNISSAVKKTFWCNAITAISSVILWALITAMFDFDDTKRLVPAASDFGQALPLTLVGSLATWFSIFLIIELGAFALATAAVAAFSIATVLIELGIYGGADSLTSLGAVECGAIVLMLASLGYLVWKFKDEQEKSQPGCSTAIEAASSSKEFCGPTSKDLYLPGGDIN